MKKGATLREKPQDKGGNITRTGTRQRRGAHYENRRKIKKGATLREKPQDKGGTLREQAQDKEGGQH